jgi:prophage regulatory protein
MKDRLAAAGLDPATVPDEEFRLWRLKEVCRRVGLSTSSIYRKVSDGTFPAPVPLGERFP